MKNCKMNYYVFVNYCDGVVMFKDLSLHKAKSLYENYLSASEWNKILKVGYAVQNNSLSQQILEKRVEVQLNLPV